jgi:hypothetical protein
MSISEPVELLSAEDLILGNVFSEDLLISNNSNDFGFLLPILSMIIEKPIESVDDLREQEIPDENDAKWIGESSSNLITIIEDFKQVYPHINNRNLPLLRNSSSDLHDHANKALIDSKSCNVSSVFQDAKNEHEKALLSIINSSKNLMIASNDQENNINSSLNFELAKQNLNESREHIEALINYII